jgi:Flp pilus assembly protein TadD
LVASPALDREAVDQAVARGSDLLKQGKLDEAQKAFRAALLLDGENARVLALLGLTHFRASQFAQARPIYEELVERAPTDASHRLNLGLVYLKLGESDKAIGSLEASRALDPSQGRAVSYLGLAYARAGRYAEAYRSFLLAGQTDLAQEIESNLTTTEREQIQSQLARAAGGVEPRTRPPKDPPKPVATVSQAAITPPPTDEQFTPDAKPAGAGAAEPNTPMGAEPAAKAAPASTKRNASADTKPYAQLSPERMFDSVEQPPPDTGRVSMPDIQIHKLDAQAAHDQTAAGRDAQAAQDEADVQAAHDATDAALDELEHGTHSGEPAAPATEIGASRMTDSLQFVLPQSDAVPTPAEGQSMISRAVEVASPSSAASGAATRVGWGSTPPVPLSQLATELLVRPDDGEEPFEVTAAGALVIRVQERVLTRLEGIHVTGGELEYEPAMRRSRGHQTEDKFDFGGARMHAVSGNGYLIAVSSDKTFTAVSLDDDIFYLREDLVFAFESTLRWENGNVPGLRGKLPVVQFRGDGAIAIQTAEPLVRVKLPPQGVLLVAAMRLAGWIGRVIPRAVVPPTDGPMGEVCVECTGEGVVLIDPAATQVITADRVRRPSKIEALKSTPPPPPQPAPIELDVVKKADWFNDDDDDAKSDEAKLDDL